MSASITVICALSAAALNLLVLIPAKIGYDYQKALLISQSHTALLPHRILPLIFNIEGKKLGSVVQSLDLERLKQLATPIVEKNQQELNTAINTLYHREIRAYIVFCIIVAAIACVACYGLKREEFREP